MEPKTRGRSVRRWVAGPRLCSPGPSMPLQGTRAKPCSLREQDVRTQHILAAKVHLGFFLYSALVPLGVEQRHARLRLEGHRIRPERDMENARTALKLLVRPI